MRRNGEQAIVIGASVAGLLAARVLAESYDRVTVLDRDRLPQFGEGRHAVPQGRHAHALLPAGQAAIEELLPGFASDAAAAGAPTYEPGADFRFDAGGHRIARVHTGLRAVVASRPLIEGVILRRVTAIGNVDIVDRCDVVGLAATGSARRVTGVRTLRRAAGAAEETRPADLVVAASGRGARIPAWLEAYGFRRAPEERVDVDILYRTWRVRLRDGALPHDKLILVGPQPGRTRGMALFEQEGGEWIFTLYGYGADDHPPRTRAEALEFAAPLTDGDVVAELQHAEWLGEPASHRFPANLRRRYERLRGFPEGLLVMGDAITSFNPIYGQGMTVAALEALALRRCLARGDRNLARRFFRAAARPVDHAWQLATGADLALPEVEPRPPLPVRVMSAYVDRVQALAERDEDAARTFVEVTAMLRPPTHLMRPALAMNAVFRRERIAIARRPAVDTV